MKIRKQPYRPSLKCFEKNYNSLGYCIFCMKNDVDLTREHIIPFAIAGLYIFQKATCDDCAKKMNSLFETKALTHDFLIPRLVLELKNKTSSVLPKLAERNVDILKPGTDGFDFSVSAKNYPPVCPMFILPRPGLLSGIDQSKGLSEFQIQLVNFDVDSNAHNYVRENFSGKVALMHKYSFGPTQMAVAKMAYAYAIAEKGFHYFHSQDIRDLILNVRNDILQFVGMYKKQKSFSSKHLHKMYLIEEMGYLTVIVHLFASFGALPYQVVVGKINK